MSDILYVMATRHEYGPALQSRIDPLITGVGPVEAAVVVAAELARRSAGGNPPALVVSLGSAGSYRLAQCGVYQAREVSWRDIDARPIGFERGVTPFLDLPPVLPLGPYVPDVPAATLSTGADIVSGADAYRRIGADMADMETYAVLRACHRFSLPLIALRGISDGAEELRHIDGWTECLDIIDEALAAAVERLERAFAEGALLPEPPGHGQSALSDPSRRM